MFKVSNPANPYTGLAIAWEEPPLPPRLELRDEHARTLLRRNRSPDVPFGWSLNVYAGCTHACAYCYARRHHEHFDLGAGTDFDRILFVKRDAAALLARELAHPGWSGEPIAMSGITDCYQPIERKLEITRAVVGVLAQWRNPVSIITRSPLVVRDIDLLAELAAVDAVRVQVSIPIGDAEVCRRLEPGAAPPAARLRAVQALADAGVPVGVSLAPIIPGLTDHLVASTLERARDAGARWAWMGLVRLPGSVEAVFTERLRAVMPARADAVLARIERARGGRMNDSRFGDRMRGQDEAWRVLERAWEVHMGRLGIDRRPPPFPARSPFRRPGSGAQLALFEPDGRARPTG